MTNDVLETFWREVIKAWDAQNMAENEGLMVTIGRPVIEAARMHSSRRRSFQGTGA